MMNVKCLTRVPVHRKGSQNISRFLTTWQPETCPHPQHNSFLALPVRCSLGGCGRPPGTWVHREKPPLGDAEPPLGDARPPIGHEGTGPIAGVGRKARSVRA